MQRRSPGRQSGGNESAPSNLLVGVLPITEALQNQGRNIERVIIAEGAREARMQTIYQQARARNVPVSSGTRRISVFVWWTATSNSFPAWNS